MKTSRFARLAVPALAACALAVAAGGAAAQTQSRMGGQSTYGNSFMPYSQSGYIGLNLGRSEYNVSCGTLPLACDQRDDFARITLGANVNQNLGYELSFMDNGSINRAGGDTRARGINLSAVGRIPLAQQFSLFGKVGATYGRTRTNAAAGTGIASGSDSGFGLGYGVGASWDFSPQWSLTLEWERHDYHFAGNGRDNIDAASVGVRYRF